METLVTGGAGFIGSHLVEELLQKGRKVVVLDDLSTGKRENLPDSEKLEFIEGSITDRELLRELFSKYKFKSVFHLAAIPSVDLSVKEPLKTHSVNCDGTLYLLEESKRVGVERFIFASSAAVYGNRPELPKREDHPVEPLTPYGVDKYSSERFVVNSYSLYGLKTTALRFFNVYGERQDPHSPYAGVISIFIDRFIRFQRGEDVKIEIFGNGKQTRDFIYVKDVVASLLTCESSEVFLGKVINVGTGKEVSLLELIDILRKITGVFPPIVFRPKRKGDIERSYADVTNLARCGYIPKFSLFEGLKRTYIWELDRRNASLEFK
ncbi:MAG: epimerase [Thermovibrio sp.]|nr:MAG: epimerase [Thermovibrio sp.]